MLKPAGRHLVAATLLLASVSRLSSAQSVTDRTPNLDDGWTVRPGVIQFNFLHRFSISNVNPNCLGPTTQLPDVVGHILRSRKIDVRTHDGRATLMKSHRTGATDTRTCTGNQRAFPRKTHSLPLMVFSQ